MTMSTKTTQTQSLQGVVQQFLDDHPDITLREALVRIGDLARERDKALCSLRLALVLQHCGETEPELIALHLSH